MGSTQNTVTNNSLSFLEKSAKFFVARLTQINEGKFVLMFITISTAFQVGTRDAKL